MRRLFAFFYTYYFLLRQNVIFFDFLKYKLSNINLCSGTTRINGYWNIDANPVADLCLNLNKRLIPLLSNSVEKLVFISAINYFTYERGSQLIQDVYRIMKKGGIVRVGVQDLEKITKFYVDKNIDFFFQKLPNGKERFEGVTIGDKFVSWFYGYKSCGHPSKYFYDYESLAHIFKKAGFSIVEKREFGDSRLPNIEMIDNRKDQMFFLEAVK